MKIPKLCINSGGKLIEDSHRVYIQINGLIVGRVFGSNFDATQLPANFDESKDHLELVAYTDS